MTKRISCCFNDISERDMDMLFLEEFACSRQFLSLFTNKIGIYNASVVSIELSKTDALLGESDITIIIESNGRKTGLLIEDKIDAQAMPEQSARYIRRGQMGIERGEYENFFSFIIAPAKYLAQNTEAQKYPYKIQYETVLKYFEELHDPRADFKIQQISHAIENQKKGYQVVEDRAVTDFWFRYSEFKKEYYPDLYLLYNGEPKGSNAIWPRFDTVINGLYIYHKTETGFVDMTFDGCANKIIAIEKLLSDVVGDYLAKDFSVQRTGKAAAVRLNVPKLDMHKPFDEQREIVDSALGKVRKLSSLAKQLDYNEVQTLLNKAHDK